MVWMDAWKLVPAGALALGCGPAVEAPDASTTSSATPATTGTSLDVTSIEPATSSPGTRADSTLSGGDTSTRGDETNAFIPVTDVASQFQCDTWAQDCPVGHKCMPWANDGGSSWNATRCSPVVEDPNHAGEACTVVDSGVSGLDDCDYSSMCWNVDPETLVGVCRPFCEGNEANAICENVCDTCPISGDGVLTICLPLCDPLAQDCSEGRGCYPVEDIFYCAADASQGMFDAGDACEFVNVCPRGQTCADAAMVPGCAGTGCCSPYCDTTAADDCDAQLPGTVCTPWYAEGAAPAGCISGGVGICAAP